MEFDVCGDGEGGGGGPGSDRTPTQPSASPSESRRARSKVPPLGGEYFPGRVESSVEKSWKERSRLRERA